MPDAPRNTCRQWAERQAAQPVCTADASRFTMALAENGS